MLFCLCHTLRISQAKFITKIALTWCQIWLPNCTKFNVRWSFAPDPTEGTHSAPQTISWIWVAWMGNRKKEMEKELAGKGRKMEGVIRYSHFWSKWRQWFCPPPNFLVKWRPWRFWPWYRYLDEEDGRVEVILEGSDRIDSTWKEYIFRFKPGDISDRLPIACTHTGQFSLLKRLRSKL